MSVESGMGGTSATSATAGGRRGLVPGRAIAVTALVLFLLMAASLLWLDRRSIERGNQLYRDGQVAAAATLYRAHATGEGEPRAAYNLGTALLALDLFGAERELARAAASADSVVAQRGSYNLGYHYLARARALTDSDSAIAFVARSILSTRHALRLDPHDAAARWNLALGEHILDSLRVIRTDSDARLVGGDDPTRIDLVALARSSEASGVSGVEPEDPRPAAERIGARSGASAGAYEAWAYHDPGPLTEAEAAELTRTVMHDPEKLIRGLLWSHRPAVDRWRGEGWPGGDW